MSIITNIWGTPECPKLLSDDMFALDCWRDEKIPDFISFELNWSQKMIDSNANIYSVLKNFNEKLTNFCDSFSQNSAQLTTFITDTSVKSVDVLAYNLKKYCESQISSIHLNLRNTTLRMSKAHPQTHILVSTFAKIADTYTDSNTTWGKILQDNLILEQLWSAYSTKVYDVFEDIWAKLKVRERLVRYSVINDNKATVNKMGLRAVIVSLNIPLIVCASLEAGGVISTNSNLAISYKNYLIHKMKHVSNFYEKHKDKIIVGCFLSTLVLASLIKPELLGGGSSNYIETAEEEFYPHTNKRM